MNRKFMFILALIFKPTYRSFNAAFYFDGLTFYFCQLEGAEQFAVVVDMLLEKLSPSWESHCQNSGVRYALIGHQPAVCVAC